MVDSNGICYLCGKPLQEQINRDHVPPQQLYADEVRKRHSPNLRTIPVHKDCNSNYQFDEDYFVNTLMPFAAGSYSGKAFYSEALTKYRSGKKQGLIRKVLREFEHRPAGLILPAGKIIKRFEGVRLHRVAWKIVRGLHFHHFKEFLPEYLVNSLRIVLPGQEPPSDFIGVIDQPTHGQYPGGFDYRFATFPEIPNFHYWALLLWDQILLLITFHGLACTCEACVAQQSQHSLTKTNIL